MVRRMVGALLTASLGVLTGAAPAEARSLVVGGDAVAGADRPYAVYLVSPRHGQFCGGTLVAARVVVTAAHCATAVPASDLGVVAGRRDRTTADGMRVGVARTWIAPNFHHPFAGDDFALLVLDRGVPYQPARLATRD
jgi:secreted trypsin-like serine protease